MKKFNDGIVDLSSFRKKKEDAKPVQETKPAEPLFSEPMILTLASPDEPGKARKFSLLVNVVYEDKQYLALEELSSPDEEIHIYEASTDDKGEFAGVKVIESDEVFAKLSEMILNVLVPPTEDEAKALNELKAKEQAYDPIH